MKVIVAFGLALLAAAPALAVQAPGSDPVVLRVRGQLAKELTVGKPLPTGRSFDLKAGDLLMLLDGKGVRTLAGPGTLVGGVFTRTGPVIARRDRIGGTRAVADRPRSAPSRGRGETWLVDLSSSNTICLPEGRQLILSRLGAESAIELQPIEGGPSSRIEWLGYARQAEWPAGLPTTPGTRYRLTGPAAAGARVIEFRSLDAADSICAAQIDRNFEATGG